MNPLNHPFSEDQLRQKIEDLKGCINTFNDYAVEIYTFLNGILYTLQSNPVTDFPDTKYLQISRSLSTYILEQKPKTDPLRENFIRKFRELESFLDFFENDIPHPRKRISVASGSSAKRLSTYSSFSQPPQPLSFKVFEKFCKKLDSQQVNLPTRRPSTSVAPSARPSSSSSSKTPSSFSFDLHSQVQWHKDIAIYQIGGITKDSLPLNYVIAFKPHSNLSQIVALFDEPREFCAAAADHTNSDFMGNIFVSGGTRISDGSLTNRAQLLDLQTRTWKELPPSSVPRSNASAVAFNSFFFVCGGLCGFRDSKIPSKSAELFDCTKGVWMDVPTMKFLRFNFQAVAMDNAVYAIGGWKSNANPIERMDFRQSRWQSLAPPPKVSSTLTANAIGSKIYACTEKDLFMYDTRNDKWTVLAPPRDRTLFHQTVIHEDQFYRFGGEKNNEISSVCSVFDTTYLRWNISYSIPMPISRTSAFISGFR